MWNEPKQDQPARIPRLYETENTDLKDKLIYLHFFIGQCNWYIVEYDGEDIFWGFAILNQDYENAEWGYISFSELKAISIYNVEIDCNQYWKIRPAREVKKIAKAHPHWENHES